MVTARAFVREPEAGELAAMETAAATAAVSPLFSADGKPRLLHMTSWIAHAGEPNKNRDAFLAEDLRAAVERGLATGEEPLMMDHNHGFNAVGAWTRATYAFDPAAGSYGVLADGVLFAWRHPELADSLLAIQARQGFVEVSMACIPGGVEHRIGDDGSSYSLLREPVFFATSVLDVPPADPHAVGLVTEDPQHTPEERRERLSLATPDWQEGEVTWVATLLRQAVHKEESMDELNTLIEAVRAAMGEVTEAQTERLTALLAAAERVPVLEAELATATDQVTTLTEAQTTLQARVAELELTLETATASRAEVDAVLAAAEAELEGFRAEAAEREAAEAAAALEARREARLAELNQTARAKLEAMPEEKRTMLVSSWMERSDEEWTATLEVLNAAAPAAPSYAERTAAEGTFSTAPGSTERAQYDFYQYTR